MVQMTCSAELKPAWGWRFLISVIIDPSEIGSGVRSHWRQRELTFRASPWLRCFGWRSGMGMPRLRHLLTLVRFMPRNVWTTHPSYQATKLKPKEQSFFTTSDQRLQTNDNLIQIRSDHRVGLLTRLLLTLIIVALLVAPCSVLLLVPEYDALKLALISGFTLLFGMMLQISTRARRVEMFASTAAYCAVLVVGFVDYYSLCLANYLQVFLSNSSWNVSH